MSGEDLNTLGMPELRLRAKNADPPIPVPIGTKKADLLAKLVAAEAADESVSVDALSTAELVSVLDNDTDTFADAGKVELPAALNELSERAKAGDVDAALVLADRGLAGDNGDAEKTGAGDGDKEKSAKKKTKKQAATADEPDEQVTERDGGLVEHRRKITDINARGDWVDPFSGLRVYFGADACTQSGAIRDGDEAFILKAAG